MCTILCRINAKDRLTNILLIENLYFAPLRRMDKEWEEVHNKRTLPVISINLYIKQKKFRNFGSEASKTTCHYSMTIMNFTFYNSSRGCYSVLYVVIT